MVGRDPDVRAVVVGPRGARAGRGARQALRRASCDRARVDRRARAARPASSAASPAGAAPARRGRPRRLLRVLAEPLRRGRVPLARTACARCRAPPRAPVHARARRRRRTDRLRAGRVDHADVRRQLQLARPGVVPAQLPRRSRRSTASTTSSATTSPSSTPPARAAAHARRGRRRPAPTGSSSLFAARRRRPPPVLRRRRAAPDRPGWRDNLLVLRVLPRRHRRRPRRLAPDRLDRARRRPDRRPARTDYPRSAVAGQRFISCHRKSGGRGRASRGGRARPP